MLITKEVEIGLSGRNSSHYEEKGYYIPRYYNELKNKMSIKEGTKIIVKIEDLSEGSNVNVQYKCDYCSEEGIENIITTSWKSYYKHKNNIVNKDACLKHISKKQDELGIVRTGKNIRYSKEQVKDMYIDLYNRINCIPKTRHIVEENKANPLFPTFYEIRQMFGTINQLKECCNINTKNISYLKEELLEKLILYIKINGIPENKRDVFRKKNGLPAYKTYAEYFGDDLIKIIELCGIKLSEEEKYQINKRGGKIVEKSKNEIIENIYKMQSKINRPLIYDDFRNPHFNEVSITTVNRVWGSMNKMKEELGLNIVQESMIDKVKSKEEMLQDMKDFIEELGRVPNSDEINNNFKLMGTGSYFKYFGGINKVFEILGCKPNKKTIALYLTNDEIKEIYKDFIEEIGITPSFDFCKNVYKLPSPKTVLRRFNCTWNEFMLCLGFTPNEQNIMGTVCYAEDGTQCFSSSECIVHNLLLSKDIVDLEKETFYKDFINKENLLKECGYMRSDWTFYYNNKLYIVEYFGMMTKQSYQEKHDRKLKVIEDANLKENFIALYPKNLNHLDEVFNFVA
jgi:hypothetical protein